MMETPCFELKLPMIIPYFRIRNSSSTITIPFPVIEPRITAMVKLPTGTTLVRLSPYGMAANANKSLLAKTVLIIARHYS